MLASLKFVTCGRIVFRKKGLRFISWLTISSLTSRSTPLKFSACFLICWKIPRSSHLLVELCGCTRSRICGNDAVFKNLHRPVSDAARVLDIRTRSRLAFQTPDRASRPNFTWKYSMISSDCHKPKSCRMAWDSSWQLGAGSCNHLVARFGLNASQEQDANSLSSFRSNRPSPPVLPKEKQNE